MDIIYTLLDYSKEQCIDEFNRFSPHITKFQVDIQDGRYLQNKTITVEEFILASKQFNSEFKSKSIFDFHLQAVDYTKDIETLSKAKDQFIIGNVFLHINLSPDITTLTKKYSDFSFCLVFNPEDSVEEYATKYDLSTIPGIQIMGVHPGPQGQAFIKETLNKIDQLRSLHYRSPIYIDGAVNPESIPFILAKENRPDFLCVGGYLTKAENFEVNLAKLHSLIGVK